MFFVHPFGPNGAPQRRGELLLSRAIDFVRLPHHHVSPGVKTQRGFRLRLHYNGSGTYEIVHHVRERCSAPQPTPPKSLYGPKLIVSFDNRCAEYPNRLSVPTTVPYLFLWLRGVMRRRKWELICLKSTLCSAENTCKWGNETDISPRCTSQPEYSPCSWYDLQGRSTRLVADAASFARTRDSM